MEVKRTFQIVAKKWETADTATFTLKTADNQPFDYQAGQYLSLVFESNGIEKRRAYSFSTCAGVDALPAITVKRVPNGEYSNWLLAHAAPGDSLTATEANGRFVLPDTWPDTLFYVAGGSGITPVMSHLKAVLSKALPSLTSSEAEMGALSNLPRIVLFYASRDSQSTIFKVEIDQWMRDFPDRFECVYFFSREKNAAHAHFGHLNNELFEALVRQRLGPRMTRKARTGTTFYLCAPVPLMRMAEMTLRTLDFPEKNIHRETFVPDTRIVPRPLDRLRTHRIIAVGKNERHDFQTFEGETILNAALRQGIPLPYTCKYGVCLTCLARCTRGAVDVDFVATTQHARPGDMVNTCIGYAMTDVVELEYETTR